MKNSIFISFAVILVLITGFITVDLTSGGRYSKRVNDKLWSLEFKINGSLYTTESVLILMDTNYKNSKYLFRSEFPVVYEVISNSK